MIGQLQYMELQIAGLSNMISYISKRVGLCVFFLFSFHNCILSHEFSLTLKLSAPPPPPLFKHRVKNRPKLTATFSLFLLSESVKVHCSNTSVLLQISWLKIV